MPRYELYCETCQTVFEPFFAETKEELLAPDLGAAALRAGARTAFCLQSFHERHSGHTLKTTEVYG